MAVMEEHGFYRYSKYIKWGCLFASVLAVGLVNWVRWKNLREASLRDNVRMLTAAWHGIESDGLRTDFLPFKGQIEWESMDVFAVDAETGLFLTPPRFEPWHSSVVDGEGLECDTQSFRNAQAGAVDWSIGADYRGLEVISVSGKTVDEHGNEVVLMVELDTWEAVHSTLKWYHWLDLVLVILFNGAVAVVIKFVHRHRDEMATQVQELLAAADDVMRVNDEITAERDHWKTKYEERGNRDTK